MYWALVGAERNTSSKYCGMWYVRWMVTIAYYNLHIKVQRIAVRREVGKQGEAIRGESRSWSGCGCGGHIDRPLQCIEGKGRSWW
jgi:hypothetical protein